VEKNSGTIVEIKSQHTVTQKIDIFNSNLSNINFRHQNELLEVLDFNTLVNSLENDITNIMVMSGNNKLKKNNKNIKKKKLSIICCSINEIFSYFSLSYYRFQRNI